MTISGRLIFFRRLPDNAEFNAVSDKVDQWLGMETLPTLVYPVFTAIFTVLTPSQQLWVSLLLPVLKLAVRAALWSVARNDDDLVGVITCCVGHLYHVLFTAMILQNSKSYKTLGVVAVFSTAQMLFNCRYILSDAKRINETRARLELKEYEEAKIDSIQAALIFAQETRIAQNLHWRTPSLLLSTYLGYRGADFLEMHRELLRAASQYNAVYVCNTPRHAAARGPHSNPGAPTDTAIQQASTNSPGMTRIFPWTKYDNVAMKQKSSRLIKLTSRSSIMEPPRFRSDRGAWTNTEREESQLARKEAVIHAVAWAYHQSEMVLLRSYITICITLFYDEIVHVSQSSSCPLHVNVQQSDMVAVVPTSACTEPQDSSLRRVYTRSVTASQWVPSLFTRIPGQYTVSKLDSFERFTLQTSHREVVGILLFTPAPSLLVNLLLESIPLADPSTGFRRSIAFQTRHFAASVIQTVFPALVKKDCVPDFPVGSWKATAAFGVIQGVIAISTNAVISLSTGLYPVPFAHFIPLLPMGVVGTLLCYRRQAWGPELPDFRIRSSQVDYRLGMETLPIFVYPVFTALFMSLPPQEQLWLSLLLPVIKLVLRHWLWLVSKDDGDLVGVITCCAGHLYHTLFTDVILQNAKSVETLAVVVLFNIGQMLLNCRYVLKDAFALEKAKIQLQGEYLYNLTDNAVYNAMLFANESEVASRLHAQQPSALLSTYPGYHGKTFIHRHSKHVRGNSSLGLSSLAHVKRVSITAIKRVHQDGDRSRSNSNTMSGSWTMHGNGLVQVLPATGDTIPKQPLTNSGTVWDATSPQANLLMKVIEELEARKASTTLGAWFKVVTGHLPGEYALDRIRRRTSKRQMAGISLLVTLGCLVSNALIERALQNGFFNLFTVKMKSLCLQNAKSSDVGSKDGTTQLSLNPQGIQ
ncbi:unnamed protein product [Phytophthora fragariaefolia]|uniref:Unnamed protein product n=1 Tax=Phytophthora fragariaefolia TaxID=1490495 RepID=A0A9W6XTS3_9STRA|nr:unnamed protein product [Phytophthora fragariaefolia]